MERICMQQKKPGQVSRKRRTRTRKSRDIPYDVLMNIFIRLPVKCILRCRAVSKEFRHIISSPMFIKLHLEFSQDPDSLQLKRHMFFQKFPSTQVASFGYQDGGFASHRFLMAGHHRNAEMLASCNGLILICILYRYYFLWNPSTRKHNLVPNPDRGNNYDELPYVWFRLFGLGYDPVTDAYKIVRVVRAHGNRARVSVYNSRTLTWKRLSKFGYYIIHTNGQGVNVNGNPHWIVVKAPGSCFYEYYGDKSLGEIKLKDGTLVIYYTIIYFNWTTERFAKVEIYDDWLKNDSLFNLGKLKGMLCLAKHTLDSTEVWVMKEYNVRESWTRLFVVPKLENLDNFLPLCMEDDECLVEDTNHKLTSYNVARGDANEILKFRNLSYENKFKTISYEETIVPVPGFH